MGLNAKIERGTRAKPQALQFVYLPGPLLLMMVQRFFRGREDSSMAEGRDVLVHLLPELVPDGKLAGGVAVVIDVLRASTTIVHALAAGCTDVRVCLEVEEARALAGSMRAGRVLLGGERGGLMLPGFDIGNSPKEYTPQACKDTTLVLRSEERRVGKECRL